MKAVIDTTDLGHGAQSLAAFLDHIDPMGDLSTLNVKDVDGNEFSRVALVQETLSDGSKVYDLVLFRSDT